MASLVKAHAEGGLDDRLAFYAKPKLLIVDELGCLPFERRAAHLFFHTFEPTSRVCRVVWFWSTDCLSLGLAG